MESAGICCYLNKERQYPNITNVHEQCLVSVDMIIKNSLVRKSLDNITVVVVAFKYFEKEINKKLFGARSKHLDKLEKLEKLQYSADDYRKDVLSTEPCYNVFQEKIRVKNGLTGFTGLKKKIRRRIFQ